MTSTAWPAVERMCNRFGDDFDEWQRGIGQLALSQRADGSYACTVDGVNLSIPRQVAKTFLVSRIVFALCVLLPNLTVIWTAHHSRTSTNTFTNLQGYCLRDRVKPYVARVRSTNGEQEVTFKNGSKIMFGARERGFGRGFDEVDIIVFDEAQILSERALAAMVPAANQSRQATKALLFFMGTPPGPEDPGEAFTRRREDALSGDMKDGVYIECSADPDADLDDHEQWAIANPSFPTHTPLESMMRMRKNLSGSSWRREALGIWDSDKQASRAVSEEDWRATATGSAPSGIRSIGVAFSYDGSRQAVAGAIKHDGGFYTELIDAHSGTTKLGVIGLADWLCADGPDGRPRWKGLAMIAISGQAYSKVLERELADRGVPSKIVHVLSTVEYCDACAILKDGLETKAVTHPMTEGADDMLSLSVASCDKKARGKSGAWGWSATTPVGDETPIEAASVAVWAAKTSKRKPGRRQAIL